MPRAFSTIPGHSLCRYLAQQSRSEYLKCKTNRDSKYSGKKSERSTLPLVGMELPVLSEKLEEGTNETRPDFISMLFLSLELSCKGMLP